MIPNCNRTVVFVFALSATLEAERKPLFGVGKKHVSQDFFKLLNQQTLRIANETVADVVWVNETQQKGATFGERYSNAFESLFNQGYNNVISIGNDSPNLTTAHIITAINSLSYQDIVFGPSKDGGVYLLGYSKKAFDPQRFKKISWLTGKVSNEVKNVAFQNNLSYSVLETLIDIDTKNDALAFAYTNQQSVFSDFILCQFKSFEKTYKNKSIGFSFNLAIHDFLRRGPPLVL